MYDSTLDLVDKNDNIIGEVKYSRAHTEGLWHRFAAVLIFNKKGELLLQKRSAKMRGPGLLTSSASGHIDKGETYEDGAKRELKEELGIECELIQLGKVTNITDYPEGLKDREHGLIYKCIYEGPFSPDPEEVSSVKFYSLRELEKMLKNAPEKFTSGFKNEFKQIREKIK